MGNIGNHFVFGVPQSDSPDSNGIRTANPNTTRTSARNDFIESEL